MSKVLHVLLLLIALVLGMVIERGGYLTDAGKALTARERDLAEQADQRQAGPGARHPHLPAGDKPPPGKQWEPFVGSADELLAKAYALPGRRDRVYFLYRTLEEMDPAQLATYAVELSAMPSTRNWQPEALAEVQRLWAAQDPQAALAWAQILTGRQRVEAMANILGAIAAENPGEALNQIASLSTAEERSRAAMTISQCLAIKDPAGAFALLQKYPGTVTSSSVAALFEIWGNSDPVAAMAALGKVTDPNSRQYASQGLFNSWASHDPQAALAAARQMTDGQARQAVVSRSLSIWAQRDLEGAKAWFQALPSAERAKTDTGDLISVVAEQDPQQALSLVSEMKGEQRTNALARIAYPWSQRDPAGAWNWVKTLDSAADQRAAIGNLGRSLRDQEPAKVLAMAQDLPEGSLRRQFLSSFLSNTSQGDSQKAKAVLQSLSPEEARGVLQGSDLISILSQSDPLAAAELLNTYGISDNDYYWKVVGAGYADQGPAKAYAWASSLPLEQQKQAMPAVLERMAQSDGLGAFQKAQLLEDQGSRKDTMQSVLSQWASSDPEGLERAVPQMSGEARTEALQSIIGQKSRDNPSEAAGYLLGLQRSSNPEDQKAAASSMDTLGTQWASQNPKAATAWGSQLPPGESQDQFIQSVASQWVREDAFNASIWIKELPAGKGREGAVNNLLSAIKDSDPESALVWAGQLPDENQRQSAIMDTLRAYLGKDPAAGRRAVEASALTPEAKQQLLQNH